jgi:hypothetical protein
MSDLMWSATETSTKPYKAFASAFYLQTAGMREHKDFVHSWSVGCRVGKVKNLLAHNFRLMRLLRVGSFALLIAGTERSF